MGSACYPTYDAEEYALSQKNFKSVKSSSSWDPPVSYGMERESISSKPICVWSEDLFSGTINENSELPVAEQNSKLPKIDSSEVESKVCESRNSRNTDALLEAMMWNRSSDAAYNLQLASPSTVSSYKAFPVTKVLPHLYIGTYDDANNEEDLRTNGITHILSLIGRKSSVK